ncbi:MAG: RecQ family ATP-dependent DNA helicase [Anaerolineae bacterium]|nr:RecQ family ATP-dependent DNA helicase [Anaerolineae bacterium]
MNTPNTPTYQAAEHWLHQVLGSDAKFRPGQWEAISALVDDRQRTLVVQRTGWGKSMVYFIATRLLRSNGAGPTILISPLLSLMRNQIQAANVLGVRAESINSANSQEENERVESLLLAGKLDLLLISPERLANQRFRAHVWERIRHQVGMLVVDEAHCISDWGHDFRPDYRRIMTILDEVLPHTPVLGTTATANDRVVADVSEILGKNLRILRGPLTRDSLALYVYPQPYSASYRLTLVAHLLSCIQGSGIIYCMTTHDCLRVSKWLNRQGFNTKPYYSQVEQDTGENRVDLEQQLLNNEVKALVASVALGMGFDKPDLHFVIHYQYPGSIIGYYQQIGRAGRGIEQAHIILIHGPGDEEIQEYFIETAFPKPQHVQQAIDALAGTDGLTRNDLMRHINVKPSTLEKILTHLEIENIVQKQGHNYYLLDANRTPDYARWERVVQQRLTELKHMQSYIQHQGCLMRFIAEALDDPMRPQPCGKCKNCRGVESKFKADPQLVQQASAFLRDSEKIIIEPRKQWPSRGFIEGAKRARFQQTNAPGVVLCHYSDQSWGDLGRRGKYIDKHFADDLVTAAAELLGSYFRTLDTQPTWVTAVPSLRRPMLVPDFARRLAQALGLAYRDAVRNTRRCPEQKTMQNSWQQALNVRDAFEVYGVSPEPVLLVDDMVDSRWTLTVIGQLLIERGCSEVHPFALAKAGRD